jgi:hypothetical protein
MTRNWLNSRFGINFVAIGLVGGLVAIAVIAVQDVSFLFSGMWPKLPWYREALYYSLSTVAAVFWAVNFFVFRSGLPRVVAIIVAISFGSYLVQPFADIHSHQLTALCLARILGFCTPLLLMRTYVVDLKAGRVAR